MSDQDGAVIMGTTAGLKTLVDDTVRVTVDFPPTVGEAVIRAFWQRGVAVALARLTGEAVTQGTGHD